MMFKQHLYYCLLITTRNKLEFIFPHQNVIIEPIPKPKGMYIFGHFHQIDCKPLKGSNKASCTAKFFTNKFFYNFSKNNDFSE